MSEVLSQSQIDALLKSVAQEKAVAESQPANIAAPAPESAGPKTRKYDFMTPKRFSRDSLRILDSVYTNYARLVATQMSSVLRLNVEVELLDIEEQKYNEFNNALNDNDVLSSISFTINDEVNDDPVLMRISNSIIYVLLDRMLGGKGEGGNEEVTGFTDIEMTLYDSINQHLVPLMSDAWVNYYPAVFAYDKLEANPRLLQAISLEDTVVIVVFNATIKDVTGQITVCLPGSGLDVMFKTFEGKRMSMSRQKDKGGKATDLILSSISGTTLEISVRLNEAKFNLEDLYLLRPGDIINLHEPKDADALVFVEGVPWYKGELGVQRQNIAIKIKDPISNTV